MSVSCGFAKRLNVLSSNVRNNELSSEDFSLTMMVQGLGLCMALTCPSSIRYLNEPQCRSSSPQVLDILGHVVSSWSVCDTVVQQSVIVLKMLSSFLADCAVLCRWLLNLLQCCRTMWK